MSIYMWEHCFFIPRDLICVVGLLTAMVTFCLTCYQLCSVYNILITIAIFTASFTWSQEYITQDCENGNKSNGLLTNISSQVLLSELFFFLRKNDSANKILKAGRFYNRLSEYGINIAFCLPVLMTCYAPAIGTALCLTVPLLYFSIDLFANLKSARITIQKYYNVALARIQIAGLQHFLVSQWIRLHVALVLRIFWALRFTYLLVSYTNVAYDDELSFFSDVLPGLCKHLLIRSCETVVALLASTSAISYFAHYLGVFLAMCLGTEMLDNGNIGTLSAMLFFILALQTGLTGLDPEKRLVRIYRNFCLISTAILHFVHSMVHPVLMSLGASGNMSVQKHARVLSMCAFLIVTPFFFMYYLWQINPVGTWLLAVTAFCIEIVIKVLVSLMVYGLFIMDAFRQKYWDKLDDYVYYIQSTGSTIEFVFGIFLFCNGAWILLFESGGTIRAIMMCIHAYFNIFLQAKEGWKTFIRRRTAVNKINSLPSASKEKLESLNDVCSICYQELNSARVTRCNHYFHEMCLRKWLYVQDSCPLCHSSLQAESSKDDSENDNSEAQLNPEVEEQNEENQVQPIQVQPNQAVDEQNGDIQVERNLRVRQRNRETQV